MSAHTPGPWKHGKASNEILAGSVSVATMAEDEEGNANLANARLIAAAPDLLEALIHRFGTTHTPEEYWSQRCVACVRGRAAIAKATHRESKP